MVIFRKIVYSVCLFIVVFLSQWQNSVFGQDSITVIQGCAQSFANKTIEVVVESDPITEMKVTLFKGMVDSTGCFCIKLVLQEITPVFINFGKYSGLLFAEPHRNYDLFLPEYEDKSPADSLNPYFEAVRFYVKIRNAVVPELTDAIANFDGIFNQYISDKFSLINKYKYYTKVDTLAPFLDSLFSDMNDPYFVAYKDYSLAYLYALAMLQNHQTIVKEYFTKRPILYKNPAYTVLFNQLFKDYIPYFSDIHYGKRLVADIARAKSYTFAMETLANNPVLENDTLRELVLIKGIYDAISAEQLPLSSCMQTLDSIKILSKINTHKNIVDNIKRKTQQLALGTHAPDFELKNVVGEMVQLQDLRGKLLYLTFVNVNSYTSPQEFATLDLLSKKYKDQLRIVTIAIGSGTMPTITKLFQEKKYEWMLLDGTSNVDLIEKYDANTSPTCYLISPELTFIQSPAPGPNDYFEYYLIKILRAQRIRELRKTN